MDIIRPDLVTVSTFSSHCRLRQSGSVVWLRDMLAEHCGIRDIVVQMRCVGVSRSFRVRAPHGTGETIDLALRTHREELVRAGIVIAA